MVQEELVKRKTFSANMEALVSMLSWVREQIALFAIDPSYHHKVELAVEEALVNVIHHAYPSDAEGEVTIEARHVPQKSLEVLIIDRGIASNPLEMIKPINPHAPLEERREGGLGLHIIRDAMDDVLYRRIDDTNQLLLIKKLV